MFGVDWVQMGLALMSFIIIWPLCGLVAWLLQIAIYVHPRDYWRQRRYLFHPVTLFNKSIPGFIALAETLSVRIPVHIMCRANGDCGWVDFGKENECASATEDSLTPDRDSERT